MWRTVFSYRMMLLGAVCLIVSCGTLRQQPPVTDSASIPQKVVELTSIEPQPVAPVVQPETPVAPQPAVQQVAETWDERVRRGLDSLCAQPLFEISHLGMFVYDLTDNRPLYARNATHRLRPASCQKLVTCIAALHFLGGDYLFRTRLFTTGTVQNGVLNGDVYVVGGMDPLFSRSGIQQMISALSREGISSIDGHLYIDLTMKDDIGYGSGWSWDDDYGPYSPLMVDAKDQFAEQWVAALGKAGIRLKYRAVGQRALPAAGTHALATITHTIDEVMLPTLKESDNIFAECIFFQIAAMGGQKLSTRKHAEAKIKDLLSQLGLPIDNYAIADGSGLSPYDYVTPEMLVALLNFAQARPEIFNHLYPALPIAGVDGTLEKRMLETAAAKNVHAKTGSVTGVSSLSGYLTASNGHLLSFSIINQGVPRSSLGREFQDQVCRFLCGGN
ncbi:MAG: D-alanyl-D-alanine carboxypeptidase/D-alanyl-D-alanine-endopeptidase [Bacteroidaceae bacterium]|nr:D-alanyl-D-alanine carboxypeptidase/D-alanyl-D-alanine-endopeptidase [Bacteroidaceae bacterium]